MFIPHYGRIIDPYQGRSASENSPSSKAIKTTQQTSLTRTISRKTSSSVSYYFSSTPATSSPRNSTEKLPFFVRNSAVITLAVSLFILSMGIVCAYYILIHLNQYLKKTQNRSTDSFEKKKYQMSNVYQRNSIATSEQSDSDTPVDRFSQFKSPTEKPGEKLENRPSIDSVELFRV